MTLPQSVSAFVLLAFGAGILAVAWHGYRDGVLPAGPNFFRGRWMPNRATNPFAGLLALVGMAPPLRLQ